MLSRRSGGIINGSVFATAAAATGYAARYRKENAAYRARGKRYGFSAPDSPAVLSGLVFARYAGFNARERQGLLRCIRGATN
jgi:hypothetical protein